MRFILALLLVGYSVAYGQGKDNSIPVEYPQNQTAFSQAIKDRVDEIFDATPDNNYMVLRITGKGENSADVKESLRLFKTRYEDISSYLKERGLKDKHITVNYGKTQHCINVFKPRPIFIKSGNVILDDSKKQCFTISAKDGGEFTTSKGYRLNFKEYSFSTENNVMLKDGEIKICLWEFSSKSDLLESGLTTSSGKDILETVGSFHIQAFSEYGDKLVMNRGGRYKVYLPEKTHTQGIFTFYGDLDRSLVNWRCDRSLPLKQELANVNGASKKSYYCVMKHIGWINCDRYVTSNSQKSNLKVRVDSNDPMTVRMIMASSNSVLPGESNVYNRKEYTFNQVPSGRTAWVFAIKNQGEPNMEVGWAKVYIDTEKTIKIDTKPMTSAHLSTLLNDIL